MMIKSVHFFIAFFAVLSPSCNAQNAKAKDITEGYPAVDSLILRKGDSLLKARNLPGIFIATSDNGKRSYYNFGYADPDNKTTFDSLTFFEAGSITKTFTALVLVSVLKEHGISEASSIIKYLPDSLQQNKSLASVSFLSLLNHTSGLERIPDDLPRGIKNQQPYKEYKKKNLFSYLKRATCKSDGKSNYSNTGFAVCGILAEIISGKTYEELLKQYAFEPLHMGAALNLPSGNTNVSQGHFGNNKAPYWEMECMAAAGAIKCSAQDLLNYLEYMNNHSGDAVISSLLKTTAAAKPNIKVCLAWHAVEKEGNPLFYWHNGGTYGFSTFAAFSKEKDKAVVVVINKFNSNDVCDRFGMLIMRKLLE